MTEDFTAELEHAHRLIDAGLEAYLTGGGRPSAQHRADATNAIDLLRRHIYFEEEYLFPPLRALGLAGPVSVMIHEHGVMWPELDRLAELVGDESATAGADVGAELLKQLANHDWKEETIVYAQARELLPAPDRAELGGLLARGDLPDGWVSQGAPR